MYGVEWLEMNHIITLQSILIFQTAIVTYNTVAIATGITASVNTGANCSVVSILSPRKSATVIITATRATARMIR